MATAITSNEKIIVTRDYTDNFSVKNDALTKLGPKYFDGVSLSALNVGALGFVLEQIANITEDSFNTSSVLVQEAFPNKAIIPESRYSHAAIFQIDNTFTKCASGVFLMLLKQDEVLQYGTKEGNRTTLILDKNTIFTVENIPFTFDYDIQITAFEKNVTGFATDYNFSAQYKRESYKYRSYDNPKIVVNSISDINDPYLKIRKTPDGTLLLQFIAHQVERTEMTDNIISNTKINYPVLTFPFENGLAGFDIFYKAPTDSEWIQLQKRIKFSLPITEPFCYYGLRDENTLEISFSSRDGYFQPEFNSEVKIIMYTTLGKEGEFESYSGSHIELLPNAETYDYNDDLTIAISPVSNCSGAAEKLSLDALQVLTVENYSNATELSTESDIENYFYNFKYRYGNEILPIKRRDDTVERLFSAFLIVKNGDYIYPTNTLNLEIPIEDFDPYTSDTYDSNKMNIGPGHIFIYKDGSLNTMVMAKDDDGNPIMIYDDDKVNEVMEENEFVYTNPFLITMTKTPNLVGIYKTITNQIVPLDFEYGDDNSFTQFITSKLQLERGLDAPDEDGYHDYTATISLVPSASIDPYVDENNSDVRVVLGLINPEGEEGGYIWLKDAWVNPDDKTNVLFSGKIKTDDYITSSGYIDIKNAIHVNPDELALHIPIVDARVNVYILYNDGITEENKFTPYYGDDFKYFKEVNRYVTRTDFLTFIEPMNMMRSTVSFIMDGEGADRTVLCNLTHLPMIKADIIKDSDNFGVFIERLTSNYNYLEDALPLLRNNTNIDLKFYNTYGKSSNYYIGDNQELIDRVNLKIGFQITLKDGTDSVKFSTEVRDFIKAFIERVNSSGSNDFYVSNLIKELENNFAEIHHMKFLGINDYSTDYQTISVKETDIKNLTKEERMRYVPEILVINSDEIKLSIISN